jgi:ProP effector
MTPTDTASPALLQRLAERYPLLFGPEPVPLKRGIYQDLLQAHAGEFEAAELKAALSRHTRSGRYLNAVAAGRPRHDLQGLVVEPMAVEHVLLALLEVFRRRQGRTQEDLGPKLQRRLLQAFEASGCTREAYAALVARQPQAVRDLVDAALGEAAARQAKDEAVARAYRASGLSDLAFADQYGLPLADVRRALDRTAAVQGFT